MATTGPRNASTDSLSGLRTYRWMGVDYPSVTSLRRLAGMPFALANWQVNQALDAAIKNVANLSTMIGVEGEDAARKWLRKEAMGVRDTSASRGTAVHEAASLGTDPKTLDPEIAAYVNQYVDFILHTGAQVLLSERQVFNLTMGYAGQLDLLLSLPVVIGTPDGPRRTVVADIKTGKGLYADHALQLVAYAVGEFVGEDDKVDGGASALLAGATGMAVVHLSPDDWELIEFAPTPSLMAAHEALTTFAHWLIANPTIDNLTTRRLTK